MTKATISWRIGAPAAKVWELMGDFNGLPKVNPEVVSSALEEGGSIRRLTLPDGAAFVERLVERDEARRSLTYQIIEAVGMELPFERYEGTFRVTDDVPGESSVLEVTGDYGPDDFSLEEARNDIDAFYSVCVEGIKKRLGA
jgi:hypothetical protein